MFYGLISLPWWGYGLVVLVLTHITAISITLYLHRYQAHRALTLHPAVSHFFRFWLWMTTGMQTKAWAAIHRKHHAKCETAEDPHSPQVMGLKRVFFEGAELYRREALNKETLARYGEGTPDDWMERNVYLPHTAKGILLMFIINIIVFGVPGAAVWACQMAWSPLFAAGIINGVGHFWGYRNFECPDASRNVLPWGIFIAGEELHNNHHTYGTSAKFSVKPWEFDIGWMYITILRFFGLAEPKRIPPVLYLSPEKKTIDLDTVKAIVTNRFQVMDQYRRTVLTPVFNELREKYQGSSSIKLPRRLKSLLTREESLISPESKLLIENTLQTHQTLKIVYQFQKQLQEIWGKTTASHKELLEAVQQWCYEAEKTGIRGLQDFANTIRSMIPAPSLPH